MGKLDDIRRELYDPNRDSEIKPRFLQGEKLPLDDEAAKSWGEPEKKMAGQRKTKFPYFIGLSVAILFIGIAAAFAAFRFGFRGHDVSLEILAKKGIESGEKVTYRITYKNQGKEALKDVVLFFSFPAGAAPLGEVRSNLSGMAEIPLADVNPGEAMQMELEARLFGKEGEAKTAEASLRYRLASGSDNFSIKAANSISILRVPLVVTLNAPEELSSKQEIVLTLDYTSSADVPFENISLGVRYPEGFVFTDSEPKPSYGNSVWNVGTIERGETGKITIRGTIKGTPSEYKVFNAQAGVYDGLSEQWTIYQIAEKVARIASPLLSLEQKTDASPENPAEFGEPLRYSIRYKNNSDVPISNLKIEVSLDDPLLNLKTLAADRAVLDGVAAKLVWNPVSFPDLKNLAPHAEGELSFSVSLVKDPPLGRKNFSVTTRAIITSLEPPKGLEGMDLSYEDLLETKISSALQFSSKALFRNQYLSPQGAVPPAVGKETVYTIIWNISGGLNDLENAEVRATLAPGAVWKKAYYPKESALSYDPATGAIVWRAGNIPGGTGARRASPYVAFQIGVTPPPNMVGKPLELLKTVEAKGKDVFTGDISVLKVEKVTTELTSDPTTESSDWVVGE